MLCSVCCTKLESAIQADWFSDLAATGHAGAASAISKGTQKRADSLKPGKCAHSKASLGANLAVYWIQIGGASAVAAAEIAEGRYGQPSQEIYNDEKDVDRIREIIRGNPKRVVENDLLSQPAEVRTALLIVPLIYGEGRGPLDQLSIQALKLPSASSRVDMISVFKLVITREAIFMFTI